VQIRCAHGIAFVDLPSSIIWFDDGGQHVESLELDRSVGERMLDQFYRSVTSLVRRSADLEDAYRAMQVVMSANESARTGKRVLLSAGKAGDGES
jgi:predicted dehydrogenase